MRIAQGLITALLLVTVMTGTALAFTDTGDTGYEEEIRALTELGLVTGFPDGTFRPHDHLSRAEVAALIVRMVGLEAAAEYNRGATLFPDVPAHHWSSGYINTAVDHGLVRGFPDGTFRPDEPVTVPEATAILIRMLGYESEASGAWPGRYLNMAVDLGLLEVGIAPGNATRGTVAVMIERTLRTPIMESGVRSERVAGEHYLGLELAAGLIVATGGVLDRDLAADQLTILTADGEQTINVNRSLAWPLGREVAAWVDDGMALAMVDLTRESRLVNGTVTGVDAGPPARVQVNGEWYEVDRDAVVYICRRQGPIDDLIGSYARVAIADTGVARVIDAIHTEPAWLLTLVSPYAREFRARTDHGLLTDRIRLSDYDIVVLERDGRQVAIGELRTGDVALVHAVNNTLYLSASGDTIHGTLSAARREPVGWTLTIDNQLYRAVNPTLSPDQNHLMFFPADPSRINEFEGQAVTAHRDVHGTVRHLSADLATAVVESRLGLIVAAPTVEDGGGMLSLLTADGRTEQIPWHPDGDHRTDWDLLTLDNRGRGVTDHRYAAVGDLVEVFVSRDGTAARIVEPPIAATDLSRWSVDRDTDRLVRSTGFWQVTPDTAFFDVGTGTTLNWPGFQTAQFYSPAPARLYSSRPPELEAVVFDSGDIRYFSGAREGVVVGRALTPGGPVLRILTGYHVEQFRLSEDTLVTARTGSNRGEVTSQLSDLGPGDFVRFRLAGGDMLYSVTEPVAENEYEFVYEYVLEHGVLWLEQEFGAEERELFLVCQSVIIFDCRNSPLMGSVDQIRSSTRLQVFRGEGEAVTVIKITGNR